MMTTRERERLAYAEGYTETAAVLAQLADFEAEVETLQEHLDNLQDRFDEVENDFSALAVCLQEVTAERDRASEQAKTYRAALMALEAEVSPAMREFIREVLA